MTQSEFGHLFDQVVLHLPYEILFLQLEFIKKIVTRQVSNIGILSDLERLSSASIGPQVDVLAKQSLFRRKYFRVQIQ
jgi:hypothetical protein